MYIVQVEIHRFIKNYRVLSAYGADHIRGKDWAQFLLDVGNGDVPLVQGGPDEDSETPCIAVPADMCVNAAVELDTFVFGDGHNFAEMSDHCILCPFHADADACNERLLARLPGDHTSRDPELSKKHHIYYARDEFCQDGESHWTQT